jgi:predicted ferric reductase
MSILQIMQNRLDRKIIIGLILITTLPFLLLFKNLTEFLPVGDSSIFWDKFIFSAGSVTGFIGGMLMIWSVMLGIKPIASLLTPDIVWATNLHKWLGKYGVLIAFTHPILEMISYLKGLSWLFVPDFSSEKAFFITAGRVSFILLLIVYISSALLRSRLRYRPWKYIHNLSYPMVYLIFPHSINIGSNLNNSIALKALWFTFFVLFVIAVLYTLLEWVGVLRPKYEIVDKMQQSGDIYVLTLKPKNRSIKPLPGQFVLMQIKSFGESHPFSIMEFDEKTGNLSLGIKALGGFTRQVDILQIGSEIRLSGPFGVFTREAQNDKPKVLVAGGIGITPFIDVINKFANDKTILLYSNKLSSQILFHDKLKNKLGVNYRSFITDENSQEVSNISYHRIDSPSLLQLIGGQDKASNYQYFLCGSPVFMNSMTDIIKSNGVPASQIFKEEFSY